MTNEQKATAGKIDLPSVERIQQEQKRQILWRTHLKVALLTSPLPPLSGLSGGPVFGPKRATTSGRPHGGSYLVDDALLCLHPLLIGGNYRPKLYYFH